MRSERSLRCRMRAGLPSLAESYAVSVLIVVVSWATRSCRAASEVAAGNRGTPDLPFPSPAVKALGTDGNRVRRGHLRGAKPPAATGSVHHGSPVVGPEVTSPFPPWVRRPGSLGASPQIGSIWKRPLSRCDRRSTEENVAAEFSGKGATLRRTGF